ncbi:hypothetical protein BJ170DRAFT_73929 [Xylariales sp. AK1849]|nr:hypothetical protein BJ170DRAFT_73929 [Xylariales sp. AK1849]
MGIMSIVTMIAAFFLSAALALPAVAGDAAAATEVPCTTGTAEVTAGYTINYAKATPTSTVDGSGYQPESIWGSSHAVATYTYGVATPLESGFAYAQFKCQYTCNAVPGSSFFVEYAGGQIGSYCTCYDDLLVPETFVPLNQTMVGAWNSICDVTHPGKA